MIYIRLMLFIKEAAMKKISLICLMLFFLLGCSSLSKDEKKFLSLYENPDYALEYQYLENDQNIVSIEYQSLMKKLKKDTFILYVGGSWCNNCQASLPFIQKSAINNDVIIYNFNPRLKNEYEYDIRNCTNKTTLGLYKRFIEMTKYQNPLGIKTENTDIDRMSVPTVLAYKKGKMVGYVTREYLYDGKILYLDDDEVKVDYSASYLNELNELMNKIK